LRGQHVALVIPKPALLCGSHELQQVRLMNIAKLVTRFDEMIAGVNITVVFQRRTISTRRGVDTQQVAPEIGFKCYIEHLHKNFAHVMPDPLLEYVD
jgi:hypothetical protein